MMSSLEQRRRTAEAGVSGEHDGFPARVFLQPIAAPSILGLAGFAGATFIVASNLAGWWGTPKSPLALAPFAAMFGGLAQFLAGMWAYKARDAIATLAHGTWGSFWLAYLILNILVGAHVIAQPTAWYVVMAMTLAASFGRTVVPLFKYERKANVPGQRPVRPIQLEWAEPGIKQ